ncbi:hypothetical protein [Bacillus taeanensis]|uniref:Uncharacterized protein n=1 Tax=Bacillus taeanensis TaxID=273032 RepID=A0A366XVR8_9BACI|nr:hypothetical protein [Bacillus taeanensis]RBW68253.1 hypothetical protein DS031_17935 [Bacillus taeanensis]
MVYRPTVRYHENFKQYVDSLFHATELDRSQIIRCALFTAAHSKEFQEVLHAYKKRDVSLPSPKWLLNEWDYWLHKSGLEKEKRGDVYADNRRKAAGKDVSQTIERRTRSESDERKNGVSGKIARRDGEVFTSQRIIGKPGGIRIRIG